MKKFVMTVRVSNCSKENRPGEPQRRQNSRVSKVEMVPRVSGRREEKMTLTFMMKYAGHRYYGKVDERIRVFIEETLCELVR